MAAAAEMAVVSLGSWFRPPRLVLTLFLGVAASFSIALGWLAWQVINQDRIVAAQRTRQRLESAADTAVATLRNRLDALTGQLEAAAASAPTATALQGSAAGNAPAGSAAWILIGGVVDIKPAGSLAFYPPAALERRAGDAAAGLFAAGEALENQQHDLPGALAAFTALARSADPRTRAGALLRIARVRSKLHQPDLALAAYDDLARLGATIVEADMPPSVLLARYGRCVILADAKRTADLAREAAQLDSELTAGTWRLTEGEYESYRAQARAWQPVANGSAASSSNDERRALAAAVAATWDEWQTTSATASVGSRLLRTSDGDVLAVWYRANGRVAALVGAEPFVKTALLASAQLALARYHARVDLSGAGASAAGDANPPAAVERQVLRAASETTLPWSIQIFDADPGADAAAVGSSRRVLIGGLAILGLFVLAGSAFIIRAVNREIEVLRLQTDFVSAVSHEFRTPLTSIAQVSEALLDGRVPEARRYEYYRMQQRDSERLQRLVESLLDFGRMESGAREYRLEDLDAAALTRSIAGEFSASARSTGYEIDMDVPTGAAVVSADRDALGRAIWNLLDNAVKYSPSCKTVWLRAGIQDGRLEISVRDCGVGVPASDHSRIFDKFTRGANVVSSGAKGTGLGLAMVRHIVRAHGGDVHVASAPGEGSTFTISLPLAARPAPAFSPGVQNGSHPDR